MAQISGRKLRGTPSEPIVNLGGEFSRLAEEEGTHKAQLARVHAELAVHKEALAHERQQHAASRETVAQLREHSADLEATIRTLLGVLDDVDTTVAHGDAEAAAVAGALEDADAAHAACEAALNETVDELEQTHAALDGECVINSMQSSELATADAALAKAREEATEKNRTASEAYMRHKRVAQQLQAKERQVALLLNEKGRMQKLLEKKDVEAREAVMALKKISTPRAVPASPRGADAAAETPSPTRMMAADLREHLHGRMAAPPGSVVRFSPFRDAAPTEGGAAAAMPGVKMSVNEWRNATPAQKTSALRAENQVLIGVLRERDEALKTAEKELAAVKKSYAALQVRWRGATGARRPASADATPSPGDAPSPASVFDSRAKPENPTSSRRPAPSRKLFLASPGVA